MISNPCLLRVFETTQLDESFAIYPSLGLALEGESSRDGRLRAEDCAPRSAVESLGGVPNSTCWNGTRGHAGADEIVDRAGLTVRF